MSVLRVTGAVSLPRQGIPRSSRAVRQPVTVSRRRSKTSSAFFMCRAVRMPSAHNRRACRRPTPQMSSTGVRASTRSMASTGRASEKTPSYARCFLATWVATLARVRVAPTPTETTIPVQRCTRWRTSRQNSGRLARWGASSLIKHSSMEYGSTCWQNCSRMPTTLAEISPYRA